MVESGKGARLVTSVPGRPTVLDNCGRTVLAVGASGFFFDHHLPLFLSFHID